MSDLLNTVSIIVVPSGSKDLIPEIPNNDSSRLLEALGTEARIVSGHGIARPATPIEAWTFAAHSFPPKVIDLEEACKKGFFHKHNFFQRADDGGVSDGDGVKSVSTDRNIVMAIAQIQLVQYRYLLLLDVHILEIKRIF
jgi:hypothetical protein